MKLARDTQPAERCQVDTRQRVALFCRVVDNYGDIGICWRLARQLQREHGLQVTLWVDDLHSFHRICAELQTDAETQQLCDVIVRHWTDQDREFVVAEVADIVIEFFGCDIPPGYIAAMAQCDPRPVWLNLEGLTAEEWVEGCHTLPSPHPRLPLTKYFFFPGFTNKTGGLLHESGLEQQRQQFQANPPQMAAFLARFGVTRAELTSFKVSLFCYSHAPVSDLFEAWQGGATAITCLVPEGVAIDAVRAFLGAEPNAGAVRSSGALTLRVLPFVSQPEYDQLLWACDFNFVRGEDSWVRAQWAGKPFVWHIYPQHENLHHKKLRAFLQRYAPGGAGLADFTWYWNGAPTGNLPQRADCSAFWQALQTGLSDLTRRTFDWQREMLANGDMTSNLLAFATLLQSAAGGKKV